MMVAQAQLIGRGQLSSGAIDALASIPDELIFDDEAMYWQVTPAITAYFGGSGTINTSIEKHIKKWKLNHD